MLLLAQHAHESKNDSAAETGTTMWPNSCIDGNYQSTQFYVCRCSSISKKIAFMKVGVTPVQVELLSLSFISAYFDACE